MTADTAPLLALARECGGTIGATAVWYGDEVFQRPTVTLDANQLAAFAAKLAERIRQDERERAARICLDEQVLKSGNDDIDTAYRVACQDCARAIRASGTSEGEANDSQ
jgi:hypothetical protein